MNDLFLTTEQLQDMTGLKQPAAQKRWLERNGIRVLVRADGHLRVLRSDVEGGQSRIEPPSVQPNFGVLRGAR